MPKVIVSAEVEDPAKWEAGFRTHADLFRNYSVTKPIHFAVAEGSRAVVCFEPENLDLCMEWIGRQETADAMAFDGVKRETVEITVLDRELEV